MSQGSAYGIPLDTDGTLSNNSDQLVATQKATKTYVDHSIAAATIVLPDGDYGDVTVSGGGTQIIAKPRANRLFNFMNLK